MCFEQTLKNVRTDTTWKQHQTNKATVKDFDTVFNQINNIQNDLNNLTSELQNIIENIGNGGNTPSGLLGEIPVLTNQEVTDLANQYPTKRFLYDDGSGSVYYYTPNGTYTIYSPS